MESKKLVFLLVAMVVGTLTPAYASRNGVLPISDGGYANANAFTSVPQFRYVAMPNIFTVGSGYGANCLSVGSFCSPWSLPCCGSCSCFPVGVGACIGYDC